MLGLSACLLAQGGNALVHDMADELRYASLVEELSQRGGIDWHILGAKHPNACAWLQVGGTSIVYPVAQAQADKPDFYLSHNLWGDPSGAGCPYVDARTSPNGQHALVYGHRMGTMGKVFSPLGDCHEQEHFEKLGELLWSTPQKGDITLQPLCALEVDMAYQHVQQFAFDDDAGLQTWLSDLLNEATAVTPNAQDLAARASRVVTLVTCSSPVAGQRSRTLVVFAAE